MFTLVRLSLLCLFCSLALGCGGGGSAPPTQDEVEKNNAAMDADMKTMMKQVPQRPK